MTAFGKDEPRRVIPRWHTVERALGEGELNSLRQGRVAIEAAAELERLRDEWLDSGRYSAAADLVGAAAVIGEVEETTDAARALVNAQFVPRLTRVAAQDWLERNADEPLVSSAEEAAATLTRDIVVARARDEIGRLKLALRRDPRQALLWAELARSYESLGQREHAAHAMSVALKATPDSRFILRSAARLAFEHEDPEKAHAIVARSPRTTNDPWLMSAEIALASVVGRRSKNLKRGQAMVEADAFAPMDIAELASALGTSELEASKTKQARRLFDRALVEPTENAVAQVEWAATHIGGITLPDEFLDRPDTYEARAIHSADEGEWRRAVDNSWLWLAALPFSEVPAIFGSYQASIGGDFNQGVAISQAGLIANEDAFMLHNNLAYALLRLDDVEAAAEHLATMERLPKGEIEETVFSATKGLAAFRTGDPEEGRRLYTEAIRRTADPRLRAIAVIELANEELRRGSPAASELLRVAEDAAGAASSSPGAQGVKLLLERLKKDAAAATRA